MSRHAWCLALVAVMVAAGVWSARGGTQAGGAAFVVLNTPAGAVWTWGANGDGQLGNNSTTTRRYAGSVSGLGTITAVAAGTTHVLALDNTGVVWAWGDNFYGALGDGTTTDRLTPVQLGLTSVVAIAAGANHSLAVNSSGELYVWGRNGNGQLGLGDTTQRNSPTYVTNAVSAIAGGATHSAFVKTDGTAWAAGYNGLGQLGDNSTTQRTSPVQMSGVTSATAVAAGANHTLILRSDNTMRATGFNSSGQLGDSSNTQRTTPVTVTGISTAVEIVAGDNFSMARLSDGTVKSFGLNSWGQLGDTTTTNRNAAVTVSGLSGIAGIGAGSTFAVAVSTTGVVYTWGSNNSGELGDGTTDATATPKAISGASYDWKAAKPTLNLNSGTYSSTQTVTVQNVMSGVDMHYTTTGAEPTLSDPTIAHNGTISITQSTTLKVKTWKSPMPESDTVVRDYVLQVTTPTRSPGTGTYTSAQTVTLSTTTSGASIRYTTDGTPPTGSSTLYSSPITVNTSIDLRAIGVKSGWADSTAGQSIYTFNYGTLAAPTVDPAAGAFTTSVELTMSSGQSGAVVRYTTNGTTPTGSSTLYTAPVTLTATTTIKAKAFHPDYVTSAETARAYEVVVATPTFAPTAGTYAAGSTITVSTATPGATITYTLDGSEPSASSPVIASGGTVVAGDYTLKAKASKSGLTSSATASAAYAVTGQFTTPRIGAGDNHTVAVRADGVAFAWGQNNDGRVGDGSTTNRLSPVTVAGLTGMQRAAGGTNHSLALKADNTVWAWGSNGSGRLGDGTTTNRSTAVQVSGLTTAVGIAAGETHSLAVRSDGIAMAWGANNSGQIGDGTTTQRTSPVQVSSLTNVSAVSGGNQFSLALKTDGTVWSWGANPEGRLGDGTTTTRTSPVQVTGVSNAVAIDAGAYHGLALTSNGSVYAWGEGTDCQHGLTTCTDRPTAVLMNVAGVSAIAAGGFHSLLLKIDGSVWAVGWNNVGQLGDGTTTTRSTAVPLTSLSNIVAIAAGNQHSLALAADGTVYAWGRNNSGEMGDGTGTASLVPVAISAANMGWRVSTPVVSLAAALYSTTQSATITCLDPGATIRYTTTGVDPTASDTTITSGGSVSITQSTTLKVSAWKAGAVTSLVVTRAYELKAVTPALTPSAGAYGSAQNVSMSTSTSGATLRYTLDGSEPSATSTEYTAAVNVANTTTVKARAFKTGWTTSDSAASSYWITGGTVATPTLTPTPGAFTAAPLVVLATSTSGATIRYTLDGSDPTSASTLYRYPFVVGVTTTVKARGFKTGWTQSAVASGAYAVDASGATATPSIVPGGGMFTTRRTVTITGPAGATLRYTTTGVDPTSNDTQVPGNGQVVVDRSQVLKVRAWETGLTQSAVRRADFVITGDVAAGSQHSVALKEDGTVVGWGRNHAGQVGDGSTTDRWSPVTITTGVVAIAAGTQHTLAVKTDGTVVGWGSRLNGRLGNGQTTGNYLSPTAITGISNAVAVAAGNDFSLVLKADGSVVGFGANGIGQLADGSITERTSPVAAVGLSGITAIEAGASHGLAIQTDAAGAGWLWAWGKNTAGQVADGSSLTRTTPVLVPITGGAYAVAGGDDTTAVLAGDGRIWTAGSNATGQLGLGTTAVTGVASPGVVSALVGIRHLAMGSAHVLAHDAIGRVWGFGDNANVPGSVGTGSRQGAGVSPTTLVAPYRTSFGTVLRLAGGGTHSLAVSASGTVLAAGNNLWGELGLGSQANQIDPINVPSLTLATNTWLTGDADSDGLSAWREYLLGTDPLNADTNANGISDGVEAGNGTTDGTNPDTDGDGVANWVEVTQGTDPFAADSDGDGVNDGADYWPLDPTRWQAPTPTPGDTTPPVITLTYPTGARPVP